MYTNSYFQTVRWIIYIFLHSVCILCVLSLIIMALNMSLIIMAFHHSALFTILLFIERKE